MMWQDFVLAGGGVGFVLALLPSVIRGARIPMATSVLTAGILTIETGVYLTLNLWFTGGAVAANAVLWWILVWRRR